MQNSKFKIDEEKKSDGKKIEKDLKKEGEEGEGLKQKIIELENQTKRTLADYQNLEKRVGEEKREWILASNKNLLLRILPVLDTLMLAAKHSGDQSLKVSVSQFLDILKSEGVLRIETKDKDFDPRFMEAIKVVEGEENKATEELRAGFMLGDQVLRPAQVVVGKKGDSETSSE